MKDIVIFGSGGFAREVHQVILDLNDDGVDWNFLGFLDGNTKRHGSVVHDAEVLGGAEWMADHPQVHVVIAVGATPSKLRVFESLRSHGAERFPALVHPRAWLGRGVSLGEGAIVCAGSLLTTDIRIGRHAILNLDCTVGHDAVIGDFATIAPSVNISGSVVVGEGCDLGTGATIIQGIEIGSWTVLGAGAVVVKDLPPNVTAVGTPAKPIKERPDGWYREP